MTLRAEPRDLLGSLEQCLAEVGTVAKQAGVRLEARFPADPRLLTSDNSDLLRLGPPILAWAIGLAGNGTEVHVGLELNDDSLMRLEIAEPVLFGSCEDDRCRVVNADADGDRLPTTVATVLNHLETIGGRLIDCDSAGGRLHLRLLLPNRSTLTP